MSGLNIRRHDFASREELAEALAATVAGKLEAGASARGESSIAVSGGSTPIQFFHALAKADVDWRSVSLTLVDERFVPPQSDRSNIGLVMKHLIQDRPRGVEIAGLWQSRESLEQAATTASQLISQLSLPFDVVMLGMGNDGHTASFFPDAVELEQLLDPTGKALVLPVHAQSAGEPRLTLTLPVIASGRFIALHIEGAEKLTTLEKALAPGSTLPIRRVIDAAKTPVEIFWAP